MAHRAKSNRPKDCPYVSKGGLKLEFALEHFKPSLQDKIAADFGSHQGGFVDCLLKNGIARVYSIDTSYGTLDWKLRNDHRVIVLERTNAMYWKSPEAIDFITIDVAWTRQQYILPTAHQAIHKEGMILSLLKPQYESSEKSNHVLSQEEVTVVIHSLLPWLNSHFRQVQYVFSPYQGSGGNIEVWLCLSEKIA